MDTKMWILILAASTVKNHPDNSISTEKIV